MTTDELDFLAADIRASIGEKRDTAQKDEVEQCNALPPLEHIAPAAETTRKR